MKNLAADEETAIAKLRVVEKDFKPVLEFCKKTVTELGLKL